MHGYCTPGQALVANALSVPGQPSGGQCGREALREASGSLTAQLPPTPYVLVHNGGAREGLRSGDLERTEDGAVGGEGASAEGPRWCRP